ncbi:MAG: MoxR family ATPase [Verrucomicrobiota bacterium]|nr:MoxR family ATPase [Verrucomicrobiota bacterium]
MLKNSEKKIIEKIAEARDRIYSELSKVLVGQKNTIEEIIIALLSRGHCLIVGVPGLGKTLLVKSLSKMFSLSFKRIQFTPDLMPADIFGTEILEEEEGTGKRYFKFMKGPIFANIVLADEINRTPPKTQAALLEAMEERQVTAGGETYTLDRPFFVLATQNPIELEGTYPLPEAQLDRFLFNVVISYLSKEDEIKMVSQTTVADVNEIEKIFSSEEIVKLQELVRNVPVSTDVIEYAVTLVSATRPESNDSSDFVKKMVKWGAGSRASQSLILAGKARALLYGRYNVSMEDVKELAVPVMRHRLIPSFHADAENLSSDKIIKKVMEMV